MSMNEQQLWQWLGESVAHKVAEESQLLFAKTIAANILLPNDAIEYAEMLYQEKLSFTHEQESIMQQVADGFFR